MGIFTLKEDCIACPALGPEVLTELQELDVHHPKNGPGQTLMTYLPKDQPLFAKNRRHVEVE